MVHIGHCVISRIIRETKCSFLSPQAPLGKEKKGRLLIFCVGGTWFKTNLDTWDRLIETCYKINWFIKRGGRHATFKIKCKRKNTLICFKYVDGWNPPKILNIWKDSQERLKSLWALKPEEVALSGPATLSRWPSERCSAWSNLRFLICKIGIKLTSLGYWSEIRTVHCTK